jgi:chromosome segregation ATPase
VGCNTKHLFKSNQIQPEVTQSTVQTNSIQMFTLAQVEEKIASALAQHEKEKAEEELRLFIEIRDAALQAAKEELLAAQQHASALTQAKQDLAQQLMTKERELEELRSLGRKNQQLEQRVVQLEKALENSNENRWGNTFNQQATKVINSELEKTITPLMSEVERLNGLLEARSQELAQLQAIRTKQQEELNVLQQQSASKSSEIFAQFGEIGERFGWVGWSRRGYRTASGILHTGLSAISAFVSDLTREYNNQQDIAF